MSWGHDRDKPHVSAEAPPLRGREAMRSTVDEAASAGRADRARAPAWAGEPSRQHRHRATIFTAEVLPKLWPTLRQPHTGAQALTQGN